MQIELYRTVPEHGIIILLWAFYIKYANIHIYSIIEWVWYCVKSYLRVNEIEELVLPTYVELWKSALFLVMLKFMTSICFAKNV